LFFLLIIFLSCLKSSPEYASADDKKITISYPAKSMAWFPIYVAEKRGFFTDEGLRPVMVLMRSGVTTTALATQQVDYTANGSALLTGVLKKIPLRLLMGLANKILFSLVVAPEITSVRDLKGKVIGINAFGGTQAVVSEAYLKHVGLEPGKSVKLLALGGEAARMAALEKRLIHATLLPPPGNVFAETQGYKILVRADEIADIAKVPSNLFGTHIEKIRQNRAEVRSVIVAILRGHRFIQQEREGTIRLIREWNELDLPAARRVYELSKAAYAEDGRLDEVAIRNLADIIQKSTDGSLSPIVFGEIFEQSLLRESIQRVR
jgi:ABC-type nitrate/sulfonate/bicarbonate transport system substrate-binding protein